MPHTTKTNRGQGRGATPVFRDAATLLLLVLLAVSVRFDRPEDAAAVEPLLGGVQAAELDEAAPPAEPAMPPAEPCPKARPAVLHPTLPAASPEELDQTMSSGQRLLILRDGKIHEIRLTARFETIRPEPDCAGQRVTLVRS